MIFNALIGFARLGAETDWYQSGFAIYNNDPNIQVGWESRHLQDQFTHRRFEENQDGQNHQLLLQQQIGSGSYQIGFYFHW